MRDMNRRFRTTLLKLESVRPMWTPVKVGSSVSEESKLTSKEAVELDQEFQVDIFTLGRLSVGAPNVMAIEVDTCPRKMRSVKSSKSSQRCSGRDKGSEIEISST